MKIAVIFVSFLLWNCIAAASIQELMKKLSLSSRKHEYQRTTSSVSSQPDQYQVSLREAAFDHNECPICFENFHQFGDMAVFKNSANKRVCPHYVCKSCSPGLVHAGTGKCPLCRAKFTKTESVDTKNPQAVFNLFDMDSSGKLDPKETVMGIEMIVPVRGNAIESYIADNWFRWDIDGNGELDFDEFKIVLQDVLKDFKGLKASPGVSSAGSSSSHSPTPELPLALLREQQVVNIPFDGTRPIPNLIEVPIEFFRFWDENGNGSLSPGELLRALIHTFGYTGRVDLINDLREKISLMFIVFDDSGDGEFQENEFQALVFSNRNSLRTLLHESTMRGPNQASTADANVRLFCDATGASQTEAREFILMTDGNVQNAIGLYFTTR